MRAIPHGGNVSVPLAGPYRSVRADGGEGWPREREPQRRRWPQEGVWDWSVEAPRWRQSCLLQVKRPRHGQSTCFDLGPCGASCPGHCPFAAFPCSRELTSPGPSPTFSLTGFESFAHVFNRHPLIQVLPSGFYSVFFSLNKTEGLCQLGTRLKPKASQRVSLAGGQLRMKCRAPCYPRSLADVPPQWGWRQGGWSWRVLRLRHLCSGKEG